MHGQAASCSTPDGVGHGSHCRLLQLHSGMCITRGKRLHLCIRPATCITTHQITLQQQRETRPPIFRR